MADMDDGGPAFPSFTNNGHGMLRAVGDGMSLRDWFAGQALAGLGEKPDWTSFRRQVAQRAEWAYAQADAMLAARKECA